MYKNISLIYSYKKFRNSYRHWLFLFHDLSLTISYTVNQIPYGSNIKYEVNRIIFIYHESLLQLIILSELSNRIGILFSN
jgi:hypothetical protein